MIFVHDILVLSKAFCLHCRNWVALYEKLGGDNEASRMMGRATQSIASHFAAQSQIDAVSAHAHVVHHTAGMINVMGFAGEGLIAC